MLTQEEIESNKERYIELIKGITRENSDIDRFLRWIEKSDFFSAPASTKFHAHYDGGLCQHSLNVYDNLVKLVDTFASHIEYEEVEDKDTGEITVKENKIHDISEDSIRIVSLLHDLAKVNFYESYMRNVNTGETDPKTGRTIWTQVKDYKIRPAQDRFVLGSHEQISEYMARTFFPLTVDESAAILNHHGGKGFDSAQTDLAPIYNRFTLALLLHMSDMISTYVSEKIEENIDE